VFYLDDDDDDDDEQVTLVTQTREIQEDVNYYNFLLEEDEGDRLFLDSTQLKPHRGTRTTMHHSHWQQYESARAGKKVRFLEKVFRFFRFLKVLKGFLRFLRLHEYFLVIARQLALLYIALY